MMIKDLRNAVDVRPGMSSYERVLRRYIMDLLENHIRKPIFLTDPATGLNTAGMEMPSSGRRTFP